MVNDEVSEGSAEVKGLENGVGVAGRKDMSATVGVGRKGRLAKCYQTTTRVDQREDGG